MVRERQRGFIYVWAGRGVPLLAKTRHGLDMQSASGERRRFCFFIYIFVLLWCSGWLRNFVIVPLFHLI